MTATLIALLGVGIAVCIVAFSAVYGLLVRPLPYVDAEQIVRIGIPPNGGPGPGPGVGSLSKQQFAALEEVSESFTQVAAWTPRTLAWLGPEGAEALHGASVSPSLLPLLKGTLHRGQSFAEVGNRDYLVGIRLPGAGLIFSSVNGRKWTEPPGKLLHDEVVPAQICRHRGVGLCGCEGVGNEGHEGRLAGRRTCAEHVAVESAHGRLAVPLSPRQLVSASSAATVGPGGSLAGRWVWRLPRRIPVPHGGARPRGSRRWRRRQ